MPEAHKTPVLALSRYLLLLPLVEMNDIWKSDMFTFYFSWISYLCMELENQSRTYLYDVSLADHRNVFSSIYSWFSPLLSPFQISSFRIWNCSMKTFSIFLLHFWNEHYYHIRHSLRSLWKQILDIHDRKLFLFQKTIYVLYKDNSNNLKAVLLNRNNMQATDVNLCK